MITPFGLREVKVKQYSGATSATLGAAQTLTVNGSVLSEKLSGNDSIVAVVSILESFEFEIGVGDIPIEALGIMTGHAYDGTTTQTLHMNAGQSFPYFVLLGQTVGDSGDDVHFCMWKCKLTTAPQYTAAGGKFTVVAPMKGIALKDEAGTALSITDLDIADNIATATSAGHGYVAGDIVLIAGANATYANGIKMVLWADTDTFTFNAIGADATGVTGTKTALKGFGEIAAIIHHTTATPLVLP